MNDLHQKYLCVADDNKFGQKLMEKFGWAKGKGLGAKEDGKIDHVKVALKNDTKGKLMQTNVKQKL